MQKSRSGCFGWIILIVVAGAFLYSFRNEFIFFRDFLLTLFQGQPLPGFPDVDNSFRIVLLIGINIFAIFVLALLMLYWLSRSAFPFRNAEQIYRLMRHVVHSTFARPSSLLMVHNGVSVGEVEQRKQNIVLVDLESVVVVEYQPIRRTAVVPGSKTISPRKSKKSLPRTRVEGAGLVFLNKSERIRGMVNLRKQQRSQTDVLGQTSDGIELSTNLFIGFTLAQPPDVIQVAYIAEQAPQNLRVVRIDPQTRRVLSFSDELDEQDRNEIHGFAQTSLFYIEPDAQLELGQQAALFPPYQIDPDRIKAGVYSCALNVSDQQISNNWTDQPGIVAVKTFHDLIAHYSLDMLYRPDDPVVFPLMDEVKPEFSRRLRYMGVMSYQFITRRDSGVIEIGQRVDHHLFRISPVKQLEGLKLLRNHGIKVLFSGFSELVPTEPLVKQQMLNYWRVHWQQKYDQILAEHEQELVKIQDSIRIQAKRDLLVKISGLFNDRRQLPEETIAMDLFQELERIANDPNTRQFLPPDIQNRLRTLRFWLLPDEKESAPAFDDSTGEDEK